METPSGIKLIKNINIVLAVTGSIGLLFGLSQIKERYMQLLEMALYVCILWFIIYGINKVKRWVVLLVLISSSFSLVRAVIKFFAFQPYTTSDLLIKFILLLFIIFYLFQIFIFSRKRVKNYFNENGTSLIA